MSWEIDKDVVSKTLQGEEVLLNLRTGTYFGLNEVGTMIWKGIRDQKEQDQILTTIADEFSTDTNTAAQDLTAFITALKVNEIIN